MQTMILSEDDHIVVVYKPAGLATQTAHVGRQDVVSELKNYLKNPYLGIIHRLDQPVEGLLVFAKNKKAAAALTGQLQEKLFSKYYYAVVCGLPEENRGRLENYIYRDRDNRAVVLDGIKEETGNRTDNIKKAVLDYTILKKSGEKEIALADITLETGRFHQIRAQMAHRGMPLLGDLKYGNTRSRELTESLKVRNVALCAYSLEFIHPVFQKKLSFQVTPSGRVFSFFSQ